MIVSQHATNSTIKLFRNTDQIVDLLLKDWDRRPIKLEEWERVFIKIFDGTREIMEREAVLNDFDRGWYLVEFTGDDDWTLGNYTYCLILKTFDEATNTEVQKTSMLWSNQDYGAQAPFKVLEGPLPQQPDAEDVPVPTTLLNSFFTTSALVGAVQVHNATGVHSFAIQFDNYSGKVRTEGTIDPDIPMTDEDWVEPTEPLVVNGNSVVSFAQVMALDNGSIISYEKNGTTILTLLTVNTQANTFTLHNPLDQSDETFDSTSTVEWTQIKGFTGTKHIAITGNYQWVRLKFETTVPITGVVKIDYRNV